MKKLITVIVILMSSSLAFSQQQLNDTEIADAIESEYLFDHAIDVNKIDVNVIDGIAEITGKVENLKAKERATKIAQIVKGVRSVSNRIKVKPSEYLSDRGIEEKAELAVLMDPATDSYELDIEVKDGVVTLTGTVDSYQEKQLCADVVKSVSGVKELKNRIEIDIELERPDIEIANEIKALLKWHEQIEDGLINVEVDDAIVKLSGAVGSASEKNLAWMTAWVSGVKSVDHSNLDVEWWLDDKDLRENKYVDKTDGEIKDAIQDAIIYDPRVYLFNIEPEVNNGWVTLRGNVGNLRAKNAAERLAENTLGVFGVHNRIKVRPEITPPGDAEIQNNINTALINNAITDSWEIGVDVNSGIVTLSGVVDSHVEKNEAEWLASGVSGVTEVNNMLQVNHPISYYWWGHYPYYNIEVMKPAENEVYTEIKADDREIKRNVGSQIWWSPFVDRDQVEISVDNGEVTLEGNVDSWREYQKAAENAWEGGAWMVDNQLEVK